MCLAGQYIRLVGWLDRLLVNVQVQSFGVTLYRSMPQMLRLLLICFKYIQVVCVCVCMRVCVCDDGVDIYIGLCFRV